MNETLLTVVSLVCSCLAIAISGTSFLWARRSTKNGYEAHRARMNTIKRDRAAQGVIMVDPDEVCPFPGCVFQGQSHEHHGQNGISGP